MEMVNHPAHYNQGKVECIDAIDSAVAGLSGENGFYIGTAIKYLFRWKWKGGVEDIDKAIWYLERLKKKQKVAKPSEKLYDSSNRLIEELIGSED